MDESLYTVGVDRVGIVLLEEQIRQLGPEAMEELLADSLLDDLEHALVRRQLGRIEPVCVDGLMCQVVFQHRNPLAPQRRHLKDVAKEGLVWIIVGRTAGRVEVEIGEQQPLPLATQQIHLVDHQDVPCMAKGGVERS